MSFTGTAQIRSSTEIQDPGLRAEAANGTALIKTGRDECGTIASVWSSPALGVFSEKGGTVTLTDNLKVYSLTFEDDSYSIEPPADGDDNIGTLSIAPFPSVTWTVDSQYAQIFVNFDRQMGALATPNKELIISGSGEMIFYNKKSYTGRVVVDKGSTLTLGQDRNPASVDGQIELLSDARINFYSYDKNRNDAPTTLSNFVFSNIDNTQPAKIYFTGPQSFNLTGNFSGFHGNSYIKSDIEISDIGLLGGAVNVEINPTKQFGSTISGTGTIGGAGKDFVLGPGFLQPGDEDTTGMLTIGGNLILSDQSTIIVAIKGTNPDLNDQVRINGSINTLAAKQFTINGDPDPGDYTIMYYDADAGDPSGAPTSVLIQGNSRKEGKISASDGKVILTVTELNE
nr:hypothetical protein [Marinicella sp. W31]MDC2876168.1 hypothetical protein [Marinicella sp. W31]